MQYMSTMSIQHLGSRLLAELASVYLRHYCDVAQISSRDSSGIVLCWGQQEAITGVSPGSASHIAPASYISLYSGSAVPSCTQARLRPEPAPSGVLPICSGTAENLRKVEHLNIATAYQIHQHGEGRLPCDADRVQLFIASFKWQHILCSHSCSLPVIHKSWSASSTHMLTNPRRHHATKCPWHSMHSV